MISKWINDRFREILALQTALIYDCAASSFQRIGSYPRLQALLCCDLSALPNTLLNYIFFTYDKSRT